MRKIEYPIIKRYSYNEDFTPYEAYKSAANMVLLDLGKVESSWKYIAQDIDNIHKSVIVAADTNKGNVKAINHYLHPYAIDVSEGIEINGEKDLKAMQTFFRKVGHST